MIIDNAVEFKAEEKYTELMLGCGALRQKRLSPEGQDQAFQNLVTCDINPSVDPDVVHDLNVTPWPFQDEEFNEVHAYEVLEHLGGQGDYTAFFNHFNELYRILKPGGYLLASTPQWDGMWAWSDPGHTRVISEGTLLFLDRDNYGQKDSPMTDYRNVYDGDFKLEGMQQAADSLYFVMRKK